jgi:PAS domain S-box-containing protein
MSQQKFRCRMTKLCLTQLSMLDVPPDEEMDRFTRLITTIIGVPVALISIIDKDQSRQFFARSHGLDEPWASWQQTPLTHSICQHVVANGKLLSVKDARIDPLFHENLAIRDLNVVSYLGVPISLPAGTNVGVLCAIDYRPRDWTQNDKLLINNLAASISDLISLRIALRVALYEGEQSKLIAQRLGVIIENSSQGAFTFDPDNFTFIDVNEIARKNLGYTLKELKKLTPANLKLDQSIEDFEYFIKPLKDGVISKLEYETVHKRKDGSTYPILVCLEYHSDKTGSAFVAFSQDITERLAMEHSLKEEAEIFAAFFHNSPEPMAVLCMDTTILQANSAYAKIIGINSIDLIGLKFIDFVPARYRDEFLRNLGTSTLENPLITRLQEIKINGQNRTFDWMSITQFIDGTATKVFSMANDITEIHDSKLAALASQQKMATFLSVMSHEIRTPLNGLLGNLELLKDTDLSGYQSSLIDNMKVSGKLLMGHVTDVLDISRYDAGKFNVHPKAENLSRLLRDLIDNQAASAADQETSLEWHWVGKPLEWVNTDRNVLQEILLNLIGNAVKFTFKGLILVEVEVLSLVNGKSEIEFRIQDTGIGIEEAQISNVFEDFSTGSVSYNRLTGGTGLGLGIAKRFTTALGGQIGCSSNPGVGSIFWVRLPLEAVAEPQIKDSVEIVLPKTNPQKVLVIEDNEINRQVAFGMLELLGHNVTEAIDGRAGVELANNEKFDLILMDISMPIMDGQAATRAIRTGNGLSANVPIVGLTANVMANERAAFLMDGMDDIISKPVTRNTLAALIHKVALTDDEASSENSGCSD